MDPILSAASIEYPDANDLMRDMCVCLNVYSCSCSCLPHALREPSPNFTDTLYTDWSHTSVFNDAEPELVEPTQYFAEAYGGQPLAGDFVRLLDDDSTTVQPSTVQIHVEGTYTPGDRLEAKSRGESRHPPHRRQAPRPDGFPCTSIGCGKTFSRSCDLNRHQKTHLGRSERPHKCSVCNEGFLYPKDRNRHQRTHEQSSSSQATLYCRVPGCSNVDGFSRRDNWLRHQRKQHSRLVTSA